MSTVNKVAELLKIDVKSDINAASITAIMRPLKPWFIENGKKLSFRYRCLSYIHSEFLINHEPTGIKFIISDGYAMLEQPLGLSHTRMHISGSAQPTVFGYKTRLVNLICFIWKKYSLNLNLNFFEMKALLGP